MKNAIRNITLGALTFGLMVMILLFMTGCKTAKISDTKTETNTTVVKDSCDAEHSQVVSRTDSSSYSKQTSDTAIGIAGKLVSITMAADNTDTTVSNGSVSLHAYTGADGKRHIDCKADSLTVVVKNLVKENTYLKKSNDSLAKQTTYTGHASTVEHQKQEIVIAEPKRSWLQRFGDFMLSVLGYLATAVIAVLLWELIKKIRKALGYGGL